MSAYVIAQIRWDDQEEYERYIAAFRPLLATSPGRCTAGRLRRTAATDAGRRLAPARRCGHAVSQPRPRASRWIADPGLSRPWLAIRHGAAETNLIMVNGLDWG